MKKLFSIVAVLIMLMAGTAWASDVTVVTNLNAPGNSMNLGFNMSGTLGVTTNGIDSSAWHPGVIGQTNTFNALGNFVGTYSTSAGNYGALGSYVNANAQGGVNTQFLMTDQQDFNVLSANHINNVVGNFYANAVGTNAAMNLKSIGSMYVWSEATNPYSAPPLQGQLIEKGASTTKNGVQISNLYLGISTSGTATMSNSNIWGWGISENGNSYTDYGGGTRTLSATGAGGLTQNGLGANYLAFNGMILPGGGNVLLQSNFANGINGTYNMNGK